MHEALLVRSRTGVSATIPEPLCDIQAQITALRDPGHPKQTVFIAARPEGTLLSTSASNAARFFTADPLTDAFLAEILGYPEDKAMLLNHGAADVVQAQDARGCIVFECGCSLNRIQESLEAAQRQMPAGGRIVVLTTQQALERRLRLLAGEANAK